MNTTIPATQTTANGDVLPPAATLSLQDAAYHTAHCFPGGVPAMAQRLGMSANTLQHKVNLRNTTHHLTLREASDMMAVSADLRLLQALAAEHGCVVLADQVGPAAAVAPVQRVMQLVHEFSGVLDAVNNALADGRVTLNELHDCERHIATQMQALNAMLTTLRGLMPPPPSSFFSGTIG